MAARRAALLTPKGNRMKITVQNDGTQPIKLALSPLQIGATIVQPGEAGTIEFESPTEGGLVWVMELGTEEPDVHGGN